MDQAEILPKLCKQCCLPIPQEAKVCTHCQSYQDWRGLFSISNTVLALLTALVSVLSVALPNLYGLMHTPRSNMAAPMVSMDGTAVRVVVNNNGDAAGVFVRAYTDSEYLAGATKIRLRDDQNALVTPGINLLMFDIVPLLTQDESYRNSLEMIQLIIQKQEAPSTDLLFQFADSDGTMKLTRLSLDAQRLFELMRANSDRCSSVKVADFYNGCIGPGAAPDSAVLSEMLKQSEVEEEHNNANPVGQPETPSPHP